MNNYEYEEDLDILYVHNNELQEKIIGTLPFGNILIDVGESGKVLGMEIDCASKIFNFPAEQLNNLKVAKLHVMKIGNMLTLGVVLATQAKEHVFQFAMPQENRLTISH